MEIRKNDLVLDQVKAEVPMVMKIGGTTYEVYTHWNPDGRQTFLEQITKLILNANIGEDVNQSNQSA